MKINSLNTTFSSQSFNPPGCDDLFVVIFVVNWIQYTLLSWRPDKALGTEAYDGDVLYPKLSSLCMW